MRAGMTVVVATALAAAGCKSLGFTDEVNRDWTALNTKAGTVLVQDATHSVLVKKFDANLAGPKPSVKLALENAGEFQDIFSVDLEFGFRAPADSFEEYSSERISIDLPDFKKGDVKELEFPVPAGQGGAYFARLLNEVFVTAGREEAKTGPRQGTLLLDKAVEVVEVSASLEAEKPTLSFTLESQSAAPVGDLRYAVKFYKDDKPLDLGRRLSGLKPVGTTLGAKGSRVTITVAGLEAAGVSLAGAKPVLRLTK